MISDSKTVDFNVAINQENGANYFQNAPFIKKLSATDGYETLPEDVKTVLEATGVFSLMPDKSWIKTVLRSDNLIKVFNGNIIYTPPINAISFFNNLRIAQGKQKQLAKFLANLFA
jgi:hypothetical protein